ncbi:glycosyltransferase [Larkinella soli]|uniref:glycosyltransferase n=1 Tax=Larkinella soli TaxID=1770527 RepID=UPI000FFBCC1B|nr:glycosyltransferase [Larkinella soli]
MDGKRPRVVHISTAHPPYDPRIVYKQCPSLTERYEVYCALPGADPKAAPGIRFIPLPYYRKVILRFLITCPLIVWRTIRLRPKIIHVYVPEFLPFAYLYQALGTVVVYEVQENLYKKMHLKKENRGWLYRWLFRWFDQRARQHFNLVFTEHGYLSTYTNLKRLHAVIYNFPALPFLEPYRRPYRRPSEPVEFFYIGWLSFERAIDTLLEGLAILKSYHADFRVHLFGRPLFAAAELETLPAYRAVRGHLEFYGYTDQHRAMSVAARAVAGLALLKPVGDYPESYTTKMFEYMALGLPVITSDFPLYREVVETHRCGICLDPYDPVALADSLRRLIENPQEAEAMGRRGRQAAETCYNWSTEKAKLLSFYKLIEKK